MDDASGREPGTGHAPPDHCCGRSARHSSALFVGGLVIYSARALSRVERVEARRSTLLDAAPPILRPGVSVGALDLAGILSRLGRETKTAAGAGQFSRSDAAWDIQLAGAGAGRVAPSVEGGRITRLRQGGAEVQSVALPPSCWRARAPTPGRTSARYTCPRFHRSSHGGPRDRGRALLRARRAHPPHSLRRTSDSFARELGTHLQSLAPEPDGNAELPISDRTALRRTFDARRLRCSLAH